MRLFTALSKNSFLVAAGVNRLKSPWGILKSEPTDVGCHFRLFLRSVSLAVLTLLCGCQTTTQSLFTASGPGWHVQQGQALWRPRQGLPEFGGDLILATNADGWALIQFDKTPLSMVFAQTTPTRWFIRFPQQQYSFSGHGPATRPVCLALSAGGPGRETASPDVAL